MRLYNIAISLFLYVLIIQSASGQSEQNSWILSEIHYGIQTPIGTLSNRYGWHFDLGARINYFTPKKLSIGLQYQFLFGSNVNEDVLAPLRGQDGSIISSNLEASFPKLNLRGQVINLMFGKWLTDHDQNRGIWIQAGPGFIQHKIHIQDDAAPLAQLMGDLRKGYDRLSNGLGAAVSAGYLMVSDNRQINFYAAVNMGIYTTVNRRGYNIDLQQIDDRRKTDSFLGISAGWIIPILTN